MPIVSYSYSVPYIAFFLFLACLMLMEFKALKEGGEVKYYHWAAIAGLLYFVGLRGFIFTDWIVYYSLFDKLPTIWEGGLGAVLDPEFTKEFMSDTEVGKAGMEIGFVYFTVFLKSIFPDYFVWVFVNTVIDIWLLSVFLKRHTNYYIFGLMLFFVFGGLLTEVNLMRNVKAILLFLVSIRYIIERRFLLFVLLNLIGFSLHSSAIVFFPFYFILHKKWPTWLLWAVFIIGNALFVAHVRYLEPILTTFAGLVGGRLEVQVKLYFAIDVYSKPVAIGYEFFEQNLTMLLLLLTKNKVIEQNKNNNVFVNAYVVNFVIYFFFSEIYIAIQRLTLLFVFSFWILLPEIYGTIQKTLVKWIFLTVIVGYCILKLAVTHCNIFSRYDNVLFGIESYEQRNTIVQNDLYKLLDPE
jgi:hypothetical protein